MLFDMTNLKKIKIHPWFQHPFLDFSGNYRHEIQVKFQTSI